MFPKKSQTDLNKNVFLHNLDEAREARRREKQMQQATIIIQKTVRGYLVRKKYRDYRKNELNQLFLGFTDPNPQKYPSLQLASTMFTHLQHFLLYYNRMNVKSNSIDLQQLLLGFINYSSTSLIADDIKYSHLAGFFNRDLNAQWMKLNQDLLIIILKVLETTELTTNDDIKIIIGSLNYLYLITDCQNELLLRTMLALNRSYLIHLGQHNLLKILKIVMIRCMHRRLETSIIHHVAILVFKLLLNSEFNRTHLILFSQTILTIPTFITMCHENSHQLFQMICQKDLFNHLICIYSIKETFVNLSENIDIIELCYMLGNIVALASIDQNQLEAMKQPFIHCLFNILDASRQRQTTNSQNSKQTKTTSVWHPIIGHVRGKTTGITVSNQEIVQRVIVQYKFLWSKSFVNMLFESIPTTSSASQSASGPKKETNIIRAKFEKLFHSKTSTDKLTTDELTQSICRITTLYQKLVQILTELRLQILCALSLQDSLISSLWQFLNNIGPTCGLKELLKIYEMNKEHYHPIFDLLQLFSNLCSYLATVLDEEEMYKEQKYLSLESWSQFTLFLNQFVYRLIRIEYERTTTSTSPKLRLENNQLYKTLHQLLILLHERNSRKSFTPDSHWLIREAKSSSSFMADLERDDSCALYLLEQIPHILTFKDRVKILQMFIEHDKEKECNEVSSLRHHMKNYYEIHRTNLFGDAFQALQNVPSTIWKNTIRISFINQQGLAEAGIDQNGIFKEFVQEVTRQAFDPAFNLFKVTENRTLYPSPMSDRTENYLYLFNFNGKILGKAVYEQIVLDIELAPFFLRHLISRKNLNYSCFDDLMFLDRDLYNNLNFVKHYDGDVSSLALTYSIDEDVLGEMVTYDIIPCGRHINVTNDDKIVYIHRMSVYRTYTRIKNQIKMFTEGFKTLMKPEWINMFSVPELQQLISGESSDIDLEDLKSNIVYQGGYHRTHPVIKWLWQTLEQDFSREERALFLRFVTSSSRAPLLGFRSLNPPFTIRYLESSERGEEGDSLGRIFRNMVTINRTSSERLPSSSTCFNLLKLPNYKTRRILMDKLRYAIKANAGFELS
ncbi:unnamed protein product [Rotaria magnacalcarata]|uniref:HECT-type E3 ubiquitin transferase n=1 Tax=Rotaria magnacalcarata TaxID=392030 RepID=A0A816R7X3_9BILA|nr:unnamed protein product [Rotaria magnacalcarata]